jgi:hypothetical protein
MIKEITIRQEGSNVLLLSGPVLIAEMPWEKARVLASAIREMAKLAEETAKADQIIDDSALLLKSGSPFTLSDNPDIKKEAAKKAWPSIKSGEVFGLPIVSLRDSSSIWRSIRNRLGLGG